MAEVDGAQNAIFEVLMYSFDDALNLLLMASEKPQEFKNFMTCPGKTGVAYREVDYKSLVVMVLSTFSSAYEALITKIDEKEQVKHIYGRLLYCFMMKETLTYKDNKDQSLSQEEAILESAYKLRNAAAHSEITLSHTTTYPWRIQFSTYWKKKRHSFEITSSELVGFFVLFSALSRNNCITTQSITNELKKFANDSSYAHHELISYFQ